MPNTVKGKTKPSFLHGLIYADTEDTVTEVKETPVQTTSVSAYQTSISIPLMTVSGAVIVPEIKEALEKVLADNNLPGEDYYDFRMAVKSMVGVGLDITSSTKASFASLSVKGMTKQIVIDTSKQYIEMLDKEKEKFLAAVSKKIDNKISKPKADVSSIEQENIALGKKIEEITKQINDNNTAISKKKGEVAEQESLIEKTKTNYEYTHTSVVKEIQDDITRLQTIIQ